MKTRLIIFSSVETLSIAEAIQSNFYHKDFSVKTWTNGFFKLSQSYISNFSDIRADYDYAIVLCGDDDKIKKRGKYQYAPRDNVLLELGMCISAFSLKRVIIVKKDNVALPTDLNGIQTITYSVEENENIDSLAGVVCSSIKKHIFNQHNMHYIKLSWDEYFYYVKNIVSRLKQSLRLGGFPFDILVGINGGGLMVADMLAREYGQNIPVLSIYADKRSGQTVFDSKDLLIDNSEIIKILQKNSIKNILLIDSFTRDGITIVEAKNYLKNNLSSKTIKSVVIYANMRLKDTKAMKDIDYIGVFKDLDNRKLSLDIF